MQLPISHCHNLQEVTPNNQCNTFDTECLYYCLFPDLRKLGMSNSFVNMYYKGLIFDFSRNRKKNNRWLAAYSCDLLTQQHIASVTDQTTLPGYVINTARLGQTASSLSFARKSVGKNGMKNAKLHERDCERDIKAAKQRVLRGRGFAYHARTLLLFCLRPSVLPYVFSSKRETARSLD